MKMSRGGPRKKLLPRNGAISHAATIVDSISDDFQVSKPLKSENTMKVSNV